MGHINFNLLNHLRRLQLASISFLMIGIGYWNKEKRKIVTDSASGNQVSDSTTTVENIAKPIFDEIETQLLPLLIQNSSAGKNTSIEEQNKLLGLTKKSIEIQKKT